MSKNIRNFLFPAMIVLMGLAFICGCETGGDTVSLNVSPADVTVVGTTNAVTFTVGGTTNGVSGSGLRNLSLPLEWRVSKPSLGYISTSSGTSASYTRTKANGVNTVHVKDQYGAEGHATVIQQ